MEVVDSSFEGSACPVHSVVKGTNENFILTKEDEIIAARARKQFPRKLNAQAAPLKKALYRLFKKIVKREISKLQRSGVIRLFSNRAGLRVKKAETQVIKAISSSDKDMFSNLIRTYGIRARTRAGRDTTNTYGGEWEVEPEHFDVFLQNRQFVWGKTLDEINMELEETFREVLIDAARAEPTPGPGAITRSLFNAALVAGGDLSPARAERIARTEMLSFQNDGINQGYIAAGIKKHRWITILDGRERREKRANHGVQNNVITKVGTPFIMKHSGNRLMYPGDASLGVPAYEIVNCRCTTVPVLK